MERVEKKKEGHSERGLLKASRIKIVKNSRDTEEVVFIASKRKEGFNESVNLENRSSLTE